MIRLRVAWNAILTRESLGLSLAGQVCLIASFGASHLASLRAPSVRAAVPLSVPQGDGGRVELIVGFVERSCEDESFAGARASARLWL